MPCVKLLLLYFIQVLSHGMKRTQLTCSRPAHKIAFIFMRRVKTSLKTVKASTPTFPPFLFSEWKANKGTNQSSIKNNKSSYPFAEQHLLEQSTAVVGVAHKLTEVRTLGVADEAGEREAFGMCNRHHAAHALHQSSVLASSSRVTCMGSNAQRRENKNFKTKKFGGCCCCCCCWLTSVKKVQYEFKNKLKNNNKINNLISKAPPKLARKCKIISLLGVSSQLGTRHINCLLVYA